MIREKQALLLMGSPKPAGSSSEVLGDYLLGKLLEQGFSGTKIHLHRTLRERESLERMLGLASAAEVVVLTFPTYCDSLPAPVIEALGEIVHHRQSASAEQKPRFLAIANCGFPEAIHNRVALACCRHFAEAAGLTWAGGLGLSGGGMLNGEPLRNRKGPVRNVIRALDMTATALAVGKPVPEAAAELIFRPMIPRWLYLAVGNWGWKRQARQFGTSRRLGERPWPDRGGATG